jgi:hypothetical protein
VPGSLLEPHDQGADIRQAQPVRHNAPQDAALLEQATILGAAAALAGDHEDHLAPVGLGPGEKAPEGGMGLLLAHAVKVDHGVDRVGAAG